VAGPEWATQARRVTRVEDIVINRDPDGHLVRAGGGDEVMAMERGDLEKTDDSAFISSRTPSSYDEKKKLSSRPGTGTTQGGPEVIMSPGDGEIQEEARGDSPAGEQPHGRLYPGEAKEIREQDAPLPDRERRAGDVTEWREGNDLIIERGIDDTEEVRKHDGRKPRAEHTVESSLTNQTLFFITLHLFHVTMVILGRS
jgi:hypothetical protein